MNIIMSRAYHNQQYPSQRLQPPQAPISAPSPIPNLKQSHSSHPHQHQHHLHHHHHHHLNSFSDIPIEELKISNEQLGHGSYGTVFKAHWRGIRVAVKQFKTKEQICSFSVEAKQLSCVKHDNIIKLFGSSHTHDSAYLVMEYAEGGSLNHLLHECRQQHYDLRHACSWAMQTAKGVAYLHGIKPKPIMHRDLKPANLLLFSRGKILKICDFGTACTVKTRMTDNRGSACYMAPEVFSTDNYSESGDVFSWSIVFWEILARQIPYATQYSNPFQILWGVRQLGYRPNEIDNCPEIIWSLITQCWHQEATVRPTMDQVVERMQIIFKLTETKSNQYHRHNDYEHRHHHHHHHQQLSPHQQNHQSQQNSSSLRSPSSCGTATTAISEATRHLKIKTEALKHRLDMLKKRRRELEALITCDKKTDNSTLDEFQQLKDEYKLKKKELEKRQVSASNTMKSGFLKFPFNTESGGRDLDTDMVSPSP